MLSLIGLKKSRKGVKQLRKSLKEKLSCPIKQERKQSLAKRKKSKFDLAGEVEMLRVAEIDAVSKVAILEAQVREREKEMDYFWNRTITTGRIQFMYSKACWRQSVQPMQKQTTGLRPSLFSCKLHKQSLTGSRKK